MVRVWEEGVSVKGAWVRVCVYTCVIVWEGNWRHEEDEGV